MPTADKLLSNTNTMWRCELLVECLRPLLPTRWNTQGCKHWRVRERPRGLLGIGHLKRDLLWQRKRGSSAGDARGCRRLRERIEIILMATARTN